MAVLFIFFHSTFDVGRSFFQFPLIFLNQLHRLRRRHFLHLSEIALNGPGADLGLIDGVAGLL
jgi:hypothetical protein